MKRSKAGNPRLFSAALAALGAVSVGATACGGGGSQASTSAGGAPAAGTGGGSGTGVGGASGGASSGAGGTSGSSAAVGGASGAAAAPGSGGSGVSGASATAGSAGAGAGAGGDGGSSGGVGAGAGGDGGGAGATPGNCTFTVSSQTADKAGPGGIPTVGIVEWSVDLANLTSASIAFGLPGEATQTAPVDTAEGPSFRTLLLGMKGSKTYSFQLQVSNGTTSCASEPYSITTGAVPSALPPITRTLGPSAAAQDRGFIITNTRSGSIYAMILDADSDPVWWAPAPSGCTRAQMSYDGKFMWMAAVNVQNQSANGGEVGRVSMDGLTRTDKIAAFSNCHHDLTVLPDGKIACLSWIQQSGNQPSDLIEGDAEGNVSTVMHLDSTAYVSSSYHANAIHYHPNDDTYTISDRQPNLYIKVSRSGALLWQFGGDCTGAPAPKCVPGTWRVNHGHHLLDDGSGTFLFFNNGSSGGSTVFKYMLDEVGTFAATQVWAYSPGTTSNTLGDVQALPNGNTLVVFSTAGVIHEIDASQQLVQSLSGAAGGYIAWRPTLYGPPPRL